MVMVMCRHVKCFFQHRTVTPVRMSCAGFSHYIEDVLSKNLHVVSLLLYGVFRLPAEWASWI